MSTKAESPIILRDHLAIERTRLANQRTLLSFLRTGLYLMVSALAVWKVEILQEVSFLMSGLIALSVGTLIVGIVNYLRMRRKIAQSYKSFPE